MLTDRSIKKLKTHRNKLRLHRSKKIYGKHTDKKTSKQRSKQKDKQQNRLCNRQSVYV